MALVIELNPGTVGIQETYNAQIATFNIYDEASMDSAISLLTNGVYTSLVSFNAQPNSIRGSYLKSVFDTPSKTRAVTFHQSSVLYNNGTSDVLIGGTGSFTAQEATVVSGFENRKMTLKLLNDSQIAYGYCAVRFVGGATARYPSGYEYTVIIFHDSGYGIPELKMLNGCVALFEGSSLSNISQYSGKFNASMATNCTSVVYEGFPKYGVGNDGANGTRFEYSMSLSLAKTINYIVFIWSNINTGHALQLFTNVNTSTQMGFRIMKDPTVSYWRVSSATLGWCDTVTLNGGTDGGGNPKPSIPWTETAIFELIITDTYVRVIFNGDEANYYDLTKNNVKLNRESLNLLIDASAVTTYPFKQASSAVTVNLFGLIGFFTYHPGTWSYTTPDPGITTRNRAFFKKLAKK